MSPEARQSNLIAWSTRMVKCHSFAIALAGIVVIVSLLGTLIIGFGWWSFESIWGWLQDGVDGESNSTTLRNLGLLALGLLALPFAIWRSCVAHRQATAALRQTDIASRQSETAERQSITTLQSFLHARYEQGTQKLRGGSPNDRLDGIDQLRRLGREHPAQYHVQVLSRLCEFVRMPIAQDQIRGEIQGALEAIGSRSPHDMDFERNENYEPNLSKANLSGFDLAGLNLAGLRLTGADLTCATLHRTNLSHCDLAAANFAKVWMLDTNLSGAQFSIGDGGYPATGLTQTQMDNAGSDQDNLPHLDGVLDVGTNAPLLPPKHTSDWLDHMRALAEKLRRSNYTSEDSAD